MKPLKIFKDSSGLTYLFYSSSELNTAVILSLVKTGTDYETKNLNGISHFIEHLFFKGTTTFSSPKELGLELDKIGADYNAFTSYEYTGYYIKTLPEYLERAIYLLSDMLINPLFDQSELEKERRVILEEINFHYDTPTSFVFDEVLKLAYGNQPAGWSILGDKKSLERINQKEIKNYFRTNYTTKNTLIVVVGNFNVNKIKKYLDQAFKKYPRNKAPIKYKFKEIVPKSKLEIINRQDIKQSHLILLFKSKGSKFLKKRRFSVGLLTSILGYGFSSRMFVSLREELGITYYLRVNNDLYTDRGYIYIQTGSTIDKTLLAFERIIEELIKLKKEKIPEEEIEKSKALLESSTLFTAESALSLGLFYGIEYLLNNKIYLLQDYLKEIKNIKENQLKNEINECLRKENLVAVILSPQKFLLKSFLEKTNYLR